MGGGGRGESYKTLRLYFQTFHKIKQSMLPNGIREEEGEISSRALDATK